MSQEFGVLLKELRLMRELRILDVSKRANVNHSYISRLEHGDRPPPQIDVLDALVEAIGLTPMEAVPLYWAARMLPPAFQDPKVSKEVFEVVRAIATTDNPRRIIAMVQLAAAAADLFDTTK